MINSRQGKTTVARLYAKFLTSLGALPGSRFVETSGSRLANDGVSGCRSHIEAILNDGGGVLFIDEAYQLTSGTSYGGGQVIDFLLPEVENLRGKIAFVLAGYNKQMETFFSHNPGIPERFPHELQFNDYGDGELLQAFLQMIVKKYSGRMVLDGALGGLYSRIVARRVGRGRGKEGFGNIRAVENALSKITERQARRIGQERKAGKKPNELVLRIVDLIGPDPRVALKRSIAWTELHSLIGLEDVKESVQVLLETIQDNYDREIEETALIEFNLNRVFLGSPGTGKTSVAQLYGQILAHIGMLSNGEGTLRYSISQSAWLKADSPSTCQESLRLRWQCSWRV